MITGLVGSTLLFILYQTYKRIQYRRKYRERRHNPAMGILAVGGLAGAAGIAGMAGVSGAPGKGREMSEVEIGSGGRAV